MTLSHVRRRTAALVLGAALLAPLSPAAPASAEPNPPLTSRSHAAAPHGGSKAATPKPARATHLGLAAYGDSDASGAVHLSGWLRWSSGASLARPQRLELWARSGSRWALVRTVTTDRAGDVEVRVRPSTTTAYRLRYAGSSAKALGSRAAASRSRPVTVRALARVTLTAPATARRGETFVVTGRVTPAGPRRSVTLTGDGATFAVLTTRSDGTFSAHVRLRTTTRLAVRVPATSGLDAAASRPRTVRVG